MSQRTVVLLVVGLTREMLPNAPRISAWAGQRRVAALEPVLPAVTCTVQASMLTGSPPRAHGIVGNGWYNREQAEVQFWKQSNHLVGGEKVWEAARRAHDDFTCAKLFWWYNMYSSADLSVTPRPIYKADGRKLPDVYSEPPELRDRLQHDLGQFPLFKFWGPAASIESSHWIASCARRVFEWHEPTLSLVYLPHLDYPLQKLGPQHEDIPEHVRLIDAEVGRLLDFYASRDVRCIVLSEYAIEAVSRPLHINRVLREAGLLRVRVEEGLELMDAGASDAFAVADHQVAHVYVRNADQLGQVADLCRVQDGVAEVLDRDGQAKVGLDHERSGELVLVADTGCWFTYYYWLDDARAPDFARTVDIHRKPGYDPVELFLNPAIRSPALALGSRLARKKLGFRTLMDVIPLQAELVRGSHGRTQLADGAQPLLIADASLVPTDAMPVTAVRDVILKSLDV